MDGVVLYFIIAQASVFAVGASLVAVTLLTIRRPPRWIYYVLTKVGAASIVGILLYAISAPEARARLEANGRLAFYVAAVLVYAIGVTGVARDIVRRVGARTSRGLPPPERVITPDGEKPEA